MQVASQDEIFSGETYGELVFNMFLAARKWTGDEDPWQWMEGCSIRANSMFSYRVRACCAEHFVLDMIACRALAWAH